MRVPLLLAAVVAVAAVAAVAATPASAASWREQRLPSGNAGSAVGGPALATNARGDVAVAWRAGRRSYLAVRRAGSIRFGHRIALPASSDPRVAVLSDGSVLVATLRTDGTTRGTHPCCPAAYVQRLRAGARRLSAARVASSRGSDFGGLAWSLAAGPGGRAALIGNGDGVELVTSRGHGVFGVPLAAAQGRFGDLVRVAFGGDGRGAALWVEGSNHEQVLRGAPIRRDGSVGAPRSYVDTPDTASDFSFFAIDAGLDRHSTLTALWVDTGGLGVTPGAVSVATGPTVAPLRPRQVLDGSGVGVAEPELAVAPDGRALAVWRRFGGLQQLGLAVRSGPGAPFHVLAPVANDRGFGARVALLAGGQGVLVSGGAATATVRTVSPAGRLGAGRSLRGAVSPIGTSAVAAAGRFTVAWGARDGLHVATLRPG